VEGEALAMLGRALVNFARLGEEPTPNMVRVFYRLKEVKVGNDG
jgi:hypothetical protein